jgi:hypothetical protein
MTDVGEPGGTAELETGLAEAAAEVRELELLRDRLVTLKNREHVLDREADGLRRAARAEAADVDRLEDLTLARVWSTLRGAHRDELARERAEADAARLRLDEATARLDALRSERERVKARIARLADAPRAHADALAALDARIQRSDDPRSRRLLELAEDRGRLVAERRELGEALQAGRAALTWLATTAEALDEAHGLSTYDTYVGGGMISSAVKHSWLDDAAAAAAQADRHLAVLRTELAHVPPVPAMSSGIAVDGLTRFADVWLDNILTDLAVRDAIRQSEQKIAYGRRKVADVVTTLTARDALAREHLDRVETERRALLLRPAPGAVPPS